MSPAHPKISVIMPAYNHEAFVGMAIESVLKQTLTDFEFVIVNDGSTDKTGAVIEGYRDPRIRYHSQENSDAFNALNKGISLSTGDLLTIINSDDVYHPQRLETMVAAMAANDAVFAFSDVEVIDTWSKKLRHDHHPLAEMLTRLKGVLRETGSLRETLLGGNLAITTSNLFFSREVVDTVGTFGAYRYGHDYDYLLRALSRYEDRMYYHPEPLLSYRVHGSNTISENPARVDIETFRILLRNLPALAACEKDRALIESFAGQVDRMSYIMKDADAMMSKVFNTLSWKITAPLRYLGEMLGRRPPE